MKVKILETDERLGIKAGEIYEAKRYQLDPHEKLSLLAREPDGYCPECNQYLHQVAWWIQGQWMTIDSDGSFRPEKVEQWK